MWWVLGCPVFSVWWLLDCVQCALGTWLCLRCQTPTDILCNAALENQHMAFGRPLVINMGCPGRTTTAFCCHRHHWDETISLPKTIINKSGRYLAAKQQSLSFLRLSYPPAPFSECPHLRPCAVSDNEIREGMNQRRLSNHITGL